MAFESRNASRRTVGIQVEKKVDGAHRARTNHPGVGLNKLIKVTTFTQLCCLPTSFLSRIFHYGTIFNVEFYPMAYNNE